MSHDTGHGHSKENVTIISFKNSFWLVVIIVGLFVAALNFIQAESTSEEGEGHEKTEHAMNGGHEAHHNEATEHKAEEPKAAEGEASEDHKAEEAKPEEEAHH